MIWGIEPQSLAWQANIITTIRYHHKGTKSSYATLLGRFVSPLLLHLGSDPQGVAAGCLFCIGDLIYFPTNLGKWWLLQDSNLHYWLERPASYSIRGRSHIGDTCGIWTQRVPPWKGGELDHFSNVPYNALLTYLIKVLKGSTSSSVGFSYYNKVVSQTFSYRIRTPPRFYLGLHMTVLFCSSLLEPFAYFLLYYNSRTYFWLGSSRNKPTH